jgi:hypothetical protein
MMTPVVVTNMEKVEQKNAEPSVVRAGADVLLRVLPKPAGRR